jgi:hypothetical protein
MRVRLHTIALSAVLLSLLLAAPAEARDRDRGDLHEYAKRTWTSFVAMTDRESGLPADILNSDGSTSVQTSTTNIGAYMWSAVAARRLGIISRRTLVRRLSRTLTTLEHMERYGNTGQYYNWYDHRTGAKLTDWPPKHDPNFHPILSSVDNGWLAVGLKIVRDSVPRLARRAGALYDAMDFGFYYRPDVNRVLFHFRPDDPAKSPCCYDTVVSESRIVDYLGLAKRQLPQKEYFGRWRTFPDTCDWNWTETRPVGTWRRYFGVDVFEGGYRYAGTRLVPSWGGSMFEALMPALFVPEERWAPRSWGRNHPLTVRAQIYHGLREARYGYWGFSPANKPEGDYGAWAYTNGVVTPHAAFLALRFAPRATLADVRALARDFPRLYGKWGFRDSVNVSTKRVSDAYLSLDQGMIMASLGNALGHDVLRRAFADRAVKRAVRPVIGVERFSTAG